MAPRVVLTATLSGVLLLAPLAGAQPARKVFVIVWRFAEGGPTGYPTSRPSWSG